MKTIFSAIYGALTGGLIVQYFYIWFLLPVFTQLPSINYAQAIGLHSFLYLFNKVKMVDVYFTSKHEEEDVIKYGSYIMPWIVLGLGFVTHFLISHFGA